MKKLKITNYTNDLNGAIIYLVKNIKDTPDVKTVITNGCIGAILQDYSDFKHCGISEMTTIPPGENYKIGNIGKIDVFINPSMKWNDDRIIMKNDSRIIDEIEVLDTVNFM